MFWLITEPLTRGLGRSEYWREESGRISKTEGHKIHWKTPTDHGCWYLSRRPSTGGVSWYRSGVGGCLEPWNCFLTLWWLRELAGGAFAARGYESASREEVPRVTTGVTKHAQWMTESGENKMKWDPESPFF